ncbi:MAG: glutaredoxin family protein [Chloroflexi bacterium]|nr:glutaredoxin family protein [Chloroflexota bacterium]
MAELIMYTLRTCPTCKRARSDLTAEGVEFEERAIDDNPRWFDEASLLALTVPILVRGDKVEVGWKGESG